MGSGAECRVHVSQLPAEVAKQSPRQREAARAACGGCPRGAQEQSYSINHKIVQGKRRCRHRRGAAYPALIAILGTAYPALIARLGTACPTLIARLGLARIVTIRLELRGREVHLTTRLTDR